MTDPTTPIDVNAATAEELDAVPGLRGHSHEIVQLRGERGDFTDLRQLDECPAFRGRLTAAARL